MLFVVNEGLRWQEPCCDSPPKKLEQEPPLQPRVVPGCTAHPRVLGRSLGGLPHPRTAFFLVPDWLWGGDGVPRWGWGGVCSSLLALPCSGVSCFSYIVAWESCVTVKRVTISLSELLPSRCRVLESSQQTSTADTLPTCSFSHPSTCTYLNNQRT